MPRSNNEKKKKTSDAALNIFLQNKSASGTSSGVDWRTEEDKEKRVAAQALDILLSERKRRQQEPSQEISEQTRPDPTELLKGSARANMNALSPARSFQEYAGLRQQREEEEARMTAARMLTGQYGYKNVAGKAVFVTPNSPLPTPTAQNTATLHEAPGAYGIKPQDYAQAMADIKKFKSLEQPEEFTEQSDFVQKWFPDVQNPTLTDFISLGEQLEGDRLEEYQNDFDAYQDYLDRGWRNEFQQNDYDIEYPEAKARYDAAIKLLGEDAEQYMSDNPAEYYERFLNTHESHAQNDDNWFDRLRAFGLTTDAIRPMDVAKLQKAGGVDAPGGLERWSHTTQEERDNYTRILDQYGYDAAKGYIESLYPVLNRRLAEYTNKLANVFAEQHPVRASIGTIAEAPVRGIDFAGMVADTVLGREVDTYDPRLNTTRYGDTVRSTVQQDMGQVGQLLYGTGMSMGDNLANRLLFGFLGNGTTMQSANMGMSSASSAYISAVDRGASHEQAMNAAVASGAAEMFFEKFSLENLIKMGDPGSLKNFFLNTLKQMGIEGSEELATGVVNELSDRMIMGEQSNYEIAVRNYMAEGRSEEEARRQANIDAASEIGMGMAGGFLSGGVMGGGQQAVAMMSQRGQNNAPQNTQEQQAQPQQRAQMQQPMQRAETGNRSVNQAQAADPLREAAYERVAQEEAERENADPDARLYDEYEQRTPAEHRNETPVAERPTPVQEARQQQSQTVQQERSEQSEPRRRLFGNRQAAQPTETREQRLTRKRPEMMSRVQQRVAQANAMASASPYAASNPEANTYYNPYSHAQEQDDTQQERYETEEQRAEAGSKEHTFRTQHGATVRDEYGDERRVNVVGIESVEDGMPVLHVLDENGEDDYYTSTDLTFDDELGELMGYEGVGRMDARGVRNYLEEYDYKKATPRQYAEAYNSVYQRAAAGLDYETAVNQSYTAQEYLTGHAATSAYSAGMNAYNQGHDTGSAEIVREAPKTEAGNASYSIKEKNVDGVYGLSGKSQNAISSIDTNTVAQNAQKGKGKLSKQYSTQKWNALGNEGKRKAIAQMELLGALATRTGKTIVVVDRIDTPNGGTANASYDSDKGIITVALEADAGAYAYAAMHELTHALKNEHSQTEWNDFVSFVKETLTKNGQSWDELVQYQMERFGYNRAQAEEEVVCNTAPAMLQDESNILKLYKGNRTLFERVVDWVRGLLKDIKTAGDVLSKRSQSWSQMDALKNDRQALQEMYDRMMAVMEKGGENREQEAEVVKLSAKDDNDAEVKSLKEQLRANKVKFSMREDSAGNALTEEQQNYFANSKVRDAQGKLMPMYHGTPNGNYDRFRSGTYFTPNREYADVYQYPSASSISVKKNADAPTTYQVYLNMEKPFDTRNPKERRLFLNEYYRKWGTGTPLMESGLPDWTDGMDLQEFIEEMGYDYDGLILDEGGVPDGNGGVKSRGLSYVIFDPTQAKTTDNKTPTDDERFRFSMRDTVEETRDLLAVHNLTEENMRNAMELGGLAMPSIAVIKAEQGHSQYGTISVIFDKSTIDPKASSDNEIYGSDAWTPTFPHVEYEVDEEVESRIREKYVKLRKKLGESMARPLYSYGNDLQHKIDSAGSVESMVNNLLNDTNMMQLYLADTGKETVDPVEKRSVTRMEQKQIDEAEMLVKALGAEAIRSYRPTDSKRWMEQHGTTLAQAYEEALTNVYGLDPEDIQMIMDDPYWTDAKKALRNAYRYLRDGAEKVTEETDYEATNNAIRNAVDAKDYEAWLNDMLTGAVKSKGIRNDANMFTPSGKRRSFKQTHWEVTLENVVRAMRKQEKTGVGTFGRSIEGAAVKKYKSIADVKADSGRLGKVDNDQYNAMRKDFSNRFNELVEWYSGGKSWTDAGDVLVEAVTKYQDAAGILKYMNQFKDYYKPNQNVAEDLAQLVDEMKNMPTGYFEAKPRRAVGFEEMAAVIVPDNLSDDVRTNLENAGVNVIEYKAGDEADRLAKMNSADVDRLKFSLRDTDENVQDALGAQQKAFEQVKGHRITAAEADKLAGTILKKANSDYDQQKLAAELSRIYDYIERGEDVDWNQVDDEMTSLMSRVMEKSKTLNLEHEEMAKPIRDYLRNTSIRLTDKQRAEAANKAGSYGAYRKGLFGRVRLTSAGGTRLDSVWAELSAMNSELFPANASEGDQAMLLMDAVDALKPVYETGMGMNVEESASWLAGQMNEAYFDLPAVKAAAQNARTFGESIVALKNAMKRFEESSWSEYQNALNSIREARGLQQRTQKQEEAAALRKKYQQWRERDTAQRREREMKAKYRPKVERTAQTLTNWLNKPTDAKHVPVGVEDSVRRMLASLDFSGKSTKTARELCDQLNGLADALLNAQEGEDENRTIFLERDQQMIDEIRRVAELIRGNTDHQQREGRGVYDLNGMELRELSKWLDVVKHVITEAGKMRGSNLPGDSVEQVAAASMEEIRRKKPQKDKKWITKEWNKHFGVDMQDSFAFFERLGTTSNAVFKGLRQGFDKMAGLVAEAEEHTKTILKGANLRQLTGKHAKKHSFQLKSGRVELTKAQIMEMYVLSKREQAQGHLYGGGFRLQGDENARPYTISKAELTAITDTLSKDEKRIADGLQRFLSKECASWGNQTSMKLLGYRKFGEEYYWPIKTDSNSRNTTKLEDNYAANISAIKNQGMTKQTIEGAKNAIVIGDIFDTYTRHISNMSAYSAYALPLSDFTRWYNSRGVKTEIEHAMGKDGLKYINNFLMAVNGSSVQQEKSGMSKAAGVLTRNAKVASVGANARVVIQQPTSYARAAMYMSPKYLSEALVMRKPDEDLVNKYCPIAQWKRWGFYETNVGPNLRQLIVGDTSAADKVREIAMKPASMGDDWTLNHLWNACEMETREVYPELERGSEEYYQQVGARMSEIIDRTQVVDSVFHRSQMMRSKNVMDQMLTNFMAEPTKTYNMLMSAISDYADNRKNKAARNRLARAFVVYGVTGIMTAAAAGVIDAFRDDDEEKDWVEKYKAAVLGDYSEAETPLDYAKAAMLESNIGSQLNPLGMLPGVNDVLSLLQGYEANRLDQQSIQRIIWAAQEVQKYVDGESKQNLYGVSYKVAQALSSVLGIPASNVMRDLNALIQTITGYSPTLNPEARKSNTAVRLYEAMAEGKKADAQKLRAELRTKAGMTDKQIDTALAEMLMEDPKVLEAWTAKSEKRYADMNRAHNAMTAKGFSSETVDKAIQKYGESVTPKEPKTKDPNEQLQVTLYSNEDVASAIRILSGVEQGGNVTEADVHAMISERVAGNSAKDPEERVKGDIQSELKKDYLAMEKRGDTAGMRKLGTIMTNVLGTTQETMDSWVKDQHADNLRTAVDTYDSRAARKAVAVMRRDGKSDSDIKKSLSGYKDRYIEAMRSGDRETANKIKTVLKSLGLTGKNGQALYTDQTFADWLN